MSPILTPLFPSTPQLSLPRISDLLRDSTQRRLRSAIAMIIALCVPSVALGVSVYVQFDGSNVIQDPALATVSGVGHEAFADLQEGEFGAFSSSPAGGTFENAYAGTLTPLTLTNIGSTPLVLAPGDIVARIDGVYVLGSQAGSSQQANSTGVFTLTGPGVPFGATARADHAIARSVASDGTILGESNNFTQVIESNGASVIPIAAAFDQVSYDLEMPGIVLGPGQFMTLNFTLTTSTAAANGGLATADFLNLAMLEVTLPSGFDPADLQSDATVPLHFVPEPATALAMPIGMVVLVAMRRVRSHAHERSQRS